MSNGIVLTVNLVGKLGATIAKEQDIQIRHGELLITIDEQILDLKELNRNERFSKEFNEKDEVKERTKYIPPMTHPWKLASFKKQLQKAHTNHVYA